MAFTTAEAVAGIIEVDEDISLEPFIVTAHELVVELCEPQGYTSERLEVIERWLSAHFYAVRDMRPSSEKAGPVAESFQYKVDLNLANTMYGQQAMMLDTKGGLKNLNDPKRKVKPQVIYVGTTQCP